VLEELKRRVSEANLELVRQGLVFQTFGNVSGIDSAREHVVIKPSGVPYDAMSDADMVVVSVKTGLVVDGTLSPSSDTATHLELYRAFPAVCGIAHTHSLFATAWAQARKEIPVLGTTHADYFHGPVPSTRKLTAAEVAKDYEAHTGRVIVERFQAIDPMHFPGVLVAGHGPFTWGKTPADAVTTAFVVEYLARLASETLHVNPEVVSLSPAQLDKHFLRKHGPDATYGQKGDRT
jgi:L-ribulose-5-phosphate 4-epimerase